MEQFATERLLWIPLTIDILEAALYDKQKLGQLCNAHVPRDWPGNDFTRTLPFFIDSRAQNPDEPIWDGMIVHRVSNVLIGSMGFKERPNGQGYVEVRFSIIPAYCNAGYATEMLCALITRAFQISDVRAVTAECSTDNAPSIRVLEKAGLERLREENGMYYWELQQSACGA